MSGHAFSYVLPLRMAAGDDLAADDLAAYLRLVSAWCDDVIVVDGSEPPVRAANGRRWSAFARHVSPDPEHACLNGKAWGVRTGIDRARHDRVVIADDDVRYDQASLHRAVALLDDHDLVCPQNYFDPLAWHAVWDTARTLLNRAAGADFPGTLAVRRSLLLSVGGYDGDVLFENLELIRTIRAHGGSVATPLDLYVRRVPPTTAQFVGQRTRQAYDEFGRPIRMAASLALLPAVAGAVARRRVPGLIGAAMATMAAAEVGRRRAGGDAVFPGAASALAPLWVLERGCCAWLAVAQRLRFGGVRYGEHIIRRAAHSERTLRRRATARDRAGQAPSSMSSIANPASSPLSHAVT